MNSDFHYYATYCAAIIAGYTHDESLDIAYSDCFVDMCTRTLLSKIEGPFASATTQLNLELMDTPTDVVGLQDITRIWASFHFLPKDLYAEPKQRCSKRYKNKYRLICGTNGALLADTVNLAKDKSLQAVGLAMHVLCDTWAHKTFAGTPSQVINGPYNVFYEIMPDGSEKKINFRHTASMPDDLDQCVYTCSLAAGSENSIMNLGHGRAGHLPDYSFIKYKYLPAWGNYEEIVKDNPSDYRHAFCQMIYALKFLHGEYSEFELEKYDFEAIKDLESEIDTILRKRQLSSADDWKALGERLSGKEIEPFDVEKYQAEYIDASEDDKDDTFLGKFILASLAQKSMITNKIFRSGSKLAGYSIETKRRLFRTMKDYNKLIKEEQ
jgi:hypothetical protein